MANANKNKGKGWERQICTHLGEVFNLSFIRVPNSGAWVGGKNAFRAAKISNEQNLLMEGDVIMPIELSHIKIEAKFYKNFSFVSLLDNNSIFNEWINQSIIGDLNKIPFIIFKINHIGAFISLNQKYIQYFKIPQNHFIYNDQIIFKYDGFFELNKQTILDLKNKLISIQ